MVINVVNLRSLLLPGLNAAATGVPAPAPVEPEFAKGDTIRLKPNDNPYKGTLKCGKGYEVLDSRYGLIRLIADNGSYGYFKSRCFELHTTSSADIAADEYEQAILAQEIMEQQ